MSTKEAFIKAIQEGYTHKGDSIVLGGGMYNKEGVAETKVSIPLKTMNRHGLIAGATGTGKTKTLQVIAEQLSLKGIPTILMDIKGDLSGLAAAGEVKDFITARSEQIGIPYETKAMPVELMTLTRGDGVHLKATAEEFGPVLLSKILSLNDVQSSVVSLVFAFCKKKKWPLVDLSDLRKTLQYCINEGKEEIEAEYGAVSSSKVNKIMRNIIELEEQGADAFFGEPSFEPNDLIRTDKNGNGVISIIRLMDIQNKPKLFSTFMIGLLNEIYNHFPEAGDSDKPKLCIFIDEAHLVFEEASSALMDQLEVVIKLIRSKGIGIFFCTQNPIDIPDSILAQLGLKVQHALRAFTEKDRKAILKASENYPITDFYDTDSLITELGIGEAFITALNEKGIPTPLVHCMCRPPQSRMDILSPEEVKSLISSSTLVPKYNKEVNRDSAAEIVAEKAKSELSPEEEKEKVKAEKEAEKETLRQA
ncbi:MAG: helicase HerA-like domain-containing protein, partial [Fluviicola sp.]